MRVSVRPAGLLVFLIAASLAVVPPARTAACAVLRFPWTAVNAIARTLIILPRLPDLARENERLQAELAERTVESAELREQLRHLQRAETLEKALGFSPRGVVAAVIGRSTLPTAHTIVLDKGSRDGLRSDAVILDAAGVIGRVTELSASTALVTLLTDPESRVAAMIERSRETGLLAGRGRRQCELIYLDAQADVREGDRVVTAGLGGAFPKGLLLGRVVRVVRDETAGAAWAVVGPAARFGQLEEVLCLTARQGA